MTDDRRWQAVCARDAARRSVCLCRTDHRYLLPPVLPFAPALRENVAFTPMPMPRRRPGFAPANAASRIKRSAAAKVEKWKGLSLAGAGGVTLEALAQPGGQPLSFPPLFKSVTGMTPKAWQQAWRARVCATRWQKGIRLPMPCWRQVSRQQQLLSSGRCRAGMTAASFAAAATIRMLLCPGDCALGAAWWRKVNAGSAPFCWVITMTHCWTTCEVSSPRPTRAGDEVFEQVAEVFAH
jgi:AraC family transcriptional regulator of adaptative response/methylated-DNA-[protein]-cysteine methyltransferase